MSWSGFADKKTMLANLPGCNVLHLALLPHTHGANERGRTNRVRRSQADFADQDFDFALQG